ncbi:hypothetical protein X777_08045 [Ooceraea biroi]|uniref:Uncharacterized protein n=1 Tax=Ooceraea biroi TaxID=2015173 RepID=A0A026W993_OOCBI|nr:hypothetical protein X777_08045 [Ooceraea biroi]
MEKRPVYSKPTFPPRSLRHLSHAPRHPVRHFALLRAANGVSLRARYHPSHHFVRRTEGQRGSREIPRTFDLMPARIVRSYRDEGSPRTRRQHHTDPTIPHPPSRPQLPHDLSGRTLGRYEASLSARRGERKWQLHDASTTNCKPTVIPPVNAQPPPYESASSWPRPGRSDVRRAGKTLSAMPKVYFGPEYIYTERDG